MLNILARISEGARNLCIAAFKSFLRGTSSLSLCSISIYHSMDVLGAEETSDYEIQT